MAIIYSYPLSTPKLDDLLIGTSVYDENATVPVIGNPTVSFTLRDIVGMIAPVIGLQDLQSVTTVGNTTTNPVIINNSLSVLTTIKDSSGSVGSVGQVLSSTATGTSWTTNVVSNNYFVTGAAFDTSAGVLTITGNNAAVGATVNLDGRYLIGNQTITLSGDLSGSGATAITTTLATVNSNVGAFTNANITVNAKGLITAATSGSTGGISLTTTGTSGDAATLVSTVLNIPTPVIPFTSLTTAGSGAATLATGVLNIPTPSTPVIPFTSLTTTGTSGASTLTAGVLNIPNYTGGGGVVTSLTTTGTSGNSTLTAGVLNVPNYSQVFRWAVASNGLGNSITNANTGSGANVNIGSGSSGGATDPKLKVSASTIQIAGSFSNGSFVNTQEKPVLYAMGQVEASGGNAHALSLAAVPNGNPTGSTLIGTGPALNFNSSSISGEKSMARISAFAEATVTTNTSPGYLKFETTPTGTGAVPIERVRIESDGNIKFLQYGSGNVTGTATYNLSVDSTGKVIETANPSGGGATVANITVTASELLNLVNAPITLVAAPGAGKGINIQQVLYFFDSGSDQYNFGSSFLINGYSTRNMSISNTDINSSSDYSNFLEPYGVLDLSAPGFSINSALVFSLNGTGQATQGNGVLYLSVAYKIIDIGPGIQAGF